MTSALQKKSTSPADLDLFNEVSAALAGNVQRAMRVGGAPSTNEPKHLSQLQLVELSGLARSTVTKLTASINDENAAPNPTLEVVCKIAQSLNLPPAFLLMREQDWIRLSQAIHYYGKVIQDAKFSNVAEMLLSLRGKQPIDIANACLKLAEEVGVFETSEPDSTAFPPPLLNNAQLKRSKKRQAIFTTSAMPPIRPMDSQWLVPALLICTIMGAHQ